MTLQEFTLTSLVVRILSFIALLLCIGLFSDHVQMLEWMLAAFVACIGTFAGMHYLVYTDQDAALSDEKIGNSKFEKITVLGSFWLPITLSAFAIFSIYYLSVEFTRLAWILVVLGGNIGLSSSRLHQMKRKKQSR